MSIRDKRLVIVAGLLALVLALVGCSGSAEEPEEVEEVATEPATEPAEEPAEEPADDAAAVEVPVVDAALAKQGWELVEEKCTVCHPLATVTEARLDWDGWKTAVAHMVDNGAALSDAEQEAVLAYLGTREQVAAAGPGLVDEKCVICHPTQQVEDANNDWDGWETAVDHMIENGAPLDDNERAVIIEYLAIRDLQ